MNTEIFYYSIIEIVISLFFGITLLYFTYKAIDRLIRKKLGISLDNISFSIFASSMLFSVAYLISGIKSPILNSLKMLSDNPEYEGSLILDGFKYSGLFLGLMIFTIVFVIFISIKLFTYMTSDVDEFNEIQKDNISVAILTATIIISISLLIKESLYLLLESFVPYPDIPNIF